MAGHLFFTCTELNMVNVHLKGIFKVLFTCNKVRAALLGKTES